LVEQSALQGLGHQVPRDPAPRPDAGLCERDASSRGWFSAAAASGADRPPVTRPRPGRGRPDFESP